MTAAAITAERRVSFRALVRLVDKMAEIDTPDYSDYGEASMGTDAAIEALVMAAPVLGVLLTPDTPKNLKRFFEHRATRARERYRRKRKPGDVPLPNGLTLTFQMQSKIFEKVYGRIFTGPGISDMPVVIKESTPNDQ